MALVRFGRLSKALVQTSRAAACLVHPAKPGACQMTEAVAGPEQMRWYPCCAGLDKPPLPKIMIKYPKGEVDAFISIADAIEDEHDEVKVDGEEVDTSKFEVVLEDGQTLWSSSGKAPSTMEILTTLQNLQAAAA